jgi:SAM-dependent methyltransferase
VNPGEYDKMYELEDHYWWFVGRRQLALGLLRESIRGGKSQYDVLDLGCGTGVVARELSTFAHPLCLDFSEIALDYCARRGLQRLVRGDGARMPLSDESFDGIVGLDIYEHIEDDLEAFRESYRVLRPGGVVVLSVPAFGFLWGPHDVALHHFRRYRRREMRCKLEAAGFVVERCTYSVFFLFPLVVLTRIFEKMRTGPAKASLPAVPSWLNKLLIRLLDFEGRLIYDRKLSLPWGSSVVAVARKPAVALSADQSAAERRAA